VGGSHPTGREHPVVTPPELADLVRDLLDLVRDDGDLAHVDAQGAELAAEVGGVGVGHLAGEKLVPDEDDAGRPRHGDVLEFYATPR
jgi:hypothetical protein